MGLRSVSASKDVTGDHIQLYDNPDLGEVSVLAVDLRHRLEPGLAQLRHAGVRLGERVLEVDGLLGVVTVFLHLRGGHEHRPDALGQFLHLRREDCLLNIAFAQIR